MMRYLLTAVVVLFGGNAAQAQVAGQPYQVPPGYEQYGAGTLINYGGFNYVTSGTGTMLLADQGGQSQGIIGQPVYQQYQPYYPAYQGGYYGGYRPYYYPHFRYYGGEWHHHYHYGW